MAVLQNCIEFVEGETGSCSETCVACGVDGTEEVSVKVEEAVDKRGEIPEAITFTDIKSEHEVRLWVCLWVCVYVGGCVCVVCV
jgi:hypothetical protein